MTKIGRRRVHRLSENIGFGQDVLRAQRNKFGLSQQDIAKITGLSRDRIYRIESEGARLKDLLEFEVLVAAYRLDAEQERQWLDLNFGTTAEKMLDILDLTLELAHIFLSKASQAREQGYLRCSMGILFDIYKWKCKLNENTSLSSERFLCIHRQIEHEWDQLVAAFATLSDYEDFAGLMVESEPCLRVKVSIEAFMEAKKNLRISHQLPVLPKCQRGVERCMCYERCSAAYRR